MSGAQAGLAVAPTPRGNRILAGYGLALMVAAGLVLVGEPAGSAWSVYGLLCEALAVGCLLRAGRDRLPRSFAGLRRLRTAAAAVAPQRQARARVDVRTRDDGLGITQARVIRSEFTKFVSLRSSRIGPAVAGGCILGSAALAAATTAASPDGVGLVPFDPSVDLLVGVELAPLIVGVLGVLVISAEYATGMIRSSLTVVPTRMPLLWAKAAVVAAAVALIAVIATPAAILLGIAELRIRGWSVEPGEPGCWSTACAATLYMVLVALAGLSLGALLRSTASSISALVGVFYAVPLVIHLLPQAAARRIGPYLPAEAGQAIWAHPHDPHLTSRVVAAAVFLAWVGAVFATASFRLLRRDV